MYDLCVRRFCHISGTTSKSKQAYMRTHQIFDHVIFLSRLALRDMALDINMCHLTDKIKFYPEGFFSGFLDDRISCGVEDKDIESDLGVGNSVKIREVD